MIRQRCIPVSLSKKLPRATQLDLEQEVESLPMDEVYKQLCGMGIHIGPLNESIKKMVAEYECLDRV
jgi:hypothetical protein